MLTIGIAEDDLKISALLKTALEENGYKVNTVADGQEALEYFLNNHFDLLILDILMPGIDGLQLCQRIRAQNQQVPILMLTAMGSLADKVTGLALGADDYLVKPFHLRELLARVSALLRRHQPYATQNEQLHFEDLSMNLASKEVQRAGKLIELSAKEFDLLELFLRHPNRLLSRQYIAEQVWGIHFDTGTNVIDVYINFLRKKIEKDFDRKLIHTRINMGYILKS